MREGQDPIKKRTSFCHDGLDFPIGSEKGKIRGGSMLVPALLEPDLGALVPASVELHSGMFSECVHLYLGSC